MYSVTNLAKNKIQQNKINYAMIFGYHLETIQKESPCTKGHFFELPLYRQISENRPSLGLSQKQERQMPATVDERVKME